MADYAWGTRSLTNLNECDERLQRVLTEALKTSPMDLMVIEGHRPRDEQNAAYASKNSKVKWPHSKHNSMPSRAADVVPLPLNWDDKRAFDTMGKHILATAKRMGIDVQWGGDFKTFYDGPHFQLKG